MITLLFFYCKTYMKSLNLSDESATTLIYLISFIAYYIINSIGYITLGIIYKPFVGPLITIALFTILFIIITIYDIIVLLNTNDNHYLYYYKINCILHSVIIIIIISILMMSELHIIHTAGLVFIYTGYTVSCVFLLLLVFYIIRSYFTKIYNYVKETMENIQKRGEYIEINN